MKSETELLTIIILSYNTKVLLKQTLNSIEKNILWRVVVVDNASTDGSVQMIKDKYKDVLLIQNKKNVGFAAGNNIALKKLNKTPYVLLLNSDTQIVGDALAKMIRYMEDNPRVGAITPKVVLINGNIDKACHRGIPTPWRSFCYYSGLEKMFPTSSLFAGYHLGQYSLDMTHEIEATAATAMMVRKEAIDEIGVLDEDFFLYAEDLDWCIRITNAGWKIVYVHDSIVRHYKSQSGKNNKEDLDKRRNAANHFYHTMKQFYVKHFEHIYPKPVKWLMFAAIDIKKWIATR